MKKITLNDHDGIRRVVFALDSEADFEVARRKFKNIPDPIHDALERWAFQGIPPCGWLECLLANDLKRCIAVCPEQFIPIVGWIQLLLETKYPFACYGRPTHVAQWCRKESRRHLIHPVTKTRVRELEDNDNQGDG